MTHKRILDLCLNQLPPRRFRFPRWRRCRCRRVSQPRCERPAASPSLGAGEHCCFWWRAGQGHHLGTVVRLPLPFPHIRQSRRLDLFLPSFAGLAVNPLLCSFSLTAVATKVSSAAQQSAAVSSPSRTRPSKRSNRGGLPVRFLPLFSALIPFSRHFRTYTPLR